MFILQGMHIYSKWNLHCRHTHTQSPFGFANGLLQVNQSPLSMLVPRWSRIYKPIEWSCNKRSKLFSQGFMRV